MGEAKSYLYLPATLATYGLAIQFTLACVGYGLALSEYGKIPASTLPERGGGASGTISSVSKSGIFQKTYQIRFKNNPYEFVIPPAVLEPLSDEGAAAAPPLERYLTEGSTVQIFTWGNGDLRRTTIMELVYQHPDGRTEKLLDQYASRRRILASHKNAPEVAQRYRNVAWLPIPLAIALHLLVLRRLRKKSPSKA